MGPSGPCSAVKKVWMLPAERVLGKLPGQASFAVSVRNDPVGRTEIERENVNLEHVAGHRSFDVNRRGDDVRTLVEVMGHPGTREIDRVAQNRIWADAMTAEPGSGVASLVLKDALVRDRVECHARSALHAQDRLRPPVGQVAP
jgi:hypothetical protein